MAARRGKNQARRSGQARHPGLTWLAAGLAIGAVVFGYLHFKGERPLDSLLPTPNPDAKAPSPSGDDPLADVPERPKPKYDFYTLLPEKEVVIPDAELDAQARAEAAQAAKLAIAQAASAQSATEPGAAPGDSLSLDGDAAHTPAVASATPAVATGPAGASADAPRYLIQAGAFRGSTEAEALKARIAMTGEVARVEVAQINGNTVHRVRMGPYPNAGALAAAKSALAAHGIDAQAIRVK
ncbi:MAG: SPOR domain-containing protein [Arenimonas sp.]